jgi:hypothetical protein
MDRDSLTLAGSDWRVIWALSGTFLQLDAPRHGLWVKPSRPDPEKEIGRLFSIRGKLLEASCELEKERSRSSFLPVIESITRALEKWC